MAQRQTRPNLRSKIETGKNFFSTRFVLRDSKRNAARKKTISPCPALRPDRDKWGMGVRQSLFPVLTFGAPFAGAVSFPTPFSTASGVCGLVAGPSNALRPWILSEAFKLAWADGCATGLRTRSRHACNSVRVLTTCPGTATAFDGAFARSHGSRLFTRKLPSFCSPAVSFLISPAPGSFSRSLPSHRELPDQRVPFVRLSTFLFLAGSTVYF